MFFNTNSIIKRAEAIYKGEIPHSEILGSGFEDFDITETRPETTTVDIKINRIFVVHNFYRGFIWVKYDCRAYDVDGKTTYGAINYQKWYIKKVDGEWEITDIYEKEKWHIGDFFRT